MLDHQQRRQAKEIANGLPIEAHHHRKVAFYGLLARVIQTEFLDEKHLGLTRPNSLEELRHAIDGMLLVAVDRGYHSMDTETQQTMHELFDNQQTTHPVRGYELAPYSLVRLYQGCGTASKAEVATLRTIVRQQHRGKLISEAGIQDSSRVPFRAALMHLADFTREHVHFENWSGNGITTGGQVFRSSLVEQDYKKGLYFVQVREDLVSQAIKDESGPQLGCPATLVEGFTKKLHTIATVAALEAGLVIPD